MSSLKKAVVVTGASSGIGRATALRLVRDGFVVAATVRVLSDADSLRREAGESLVPVQMDVTDAASIASATRVTSQELLSRGAELVGLVNNAGIGVSGPLEYMPLDDLRRALEVNVVGQIAVTQAFLPLLRAGHGRVINIGSVGDRIAIPFGGVLNGSKCAFAMMSDSLRMELRPWGIHVVLIEPATIATPAVDKTLGDPDGVLHRMVPDAERNYGDMFRAFTKRAAAREHDGSPPEVVANIISRAMRAKIPRRRYPVGKNAGLLIMLPRLVPDRLLDVLRMRLFGLPTRFGGLIRG